MWRELKIYSPFTFVFASLRVVHSKLRNDNTLVATKEHVILRRFVVVTWMPDERELI